MKRNAIALSLCLLAGCSRNLGTLEKIRDGLQRELSDKTAVVSTLSTRRREVEELRVKIAEQLKSAGITQDELHVSVPPEPDSVTVPLPPVPEHSIFEGVQGARLRAEIALLEAEVPMLDRELLEVRKVEHEKAEAQAMLRAIDDLQRAHDVNQANEAR